MINGMLFGVRTNIILVMLAWGLVEYIIAALAGAALYKED